MGVVDELVLARETYERGDWAAAFEAWSDVRPEALSTDDLARLAIAAQLLGRHETCIDALQRAFQLHVGAADSAAACRAAFWLGMVHTENGESTMAGGWTARAQRLLDDLDDDVERGYVSMLMMYRHLHVADWVNATRCAEVVIDHGRRFGDPDLTAMGLAALGRFTLYAGRVPEGLALFDEALASVAAGEVSAVFAGNIYCVMIEGCQEVSDLQRAAAWTTALSRWCAEQPGLVAFTGQCAVHRGQIMRLHGAFADALAEYDAAVRRHLAGPTTTPAGLALAERGDVHRILGDLERAEASYEQAADHGYEPQPGLALLWLAHGRSDAALASMRRLLAETPDPVGRSRILPAAIEILLAGDDVARARDAATELDEIARDFGCDGLEAAAAYAAGRVELAAGDAPDALPYLRKSAALWAAMDATYEAARVRVQVARALTALGDDESATHALAGARRTFLDLGATPAADEVARLLAPAALPDGPTDQFENGR